MTPPRRAHLYVDGVWAGSGPVADDGWVECTAELVLGDGDATLAVYEELACAIRDHPDAECGWLALPTGEVLEWEVDVEVGE